MDDSESATTIVATVKPEGGRKKTYLYESAATSAAIVTDSSAATNITLAPVHFEEVTETVERSKGFLEGIKFGIEIPKIARFEFEKKHKKEIKTTTKKIFRKPRKK